jgi:transcriptional regulator with XRE-family HTH domain
MRHLREEKKMTQFDIAKHLHVWVQQVGSYERGDVTPSFGRIQDIAKVLDVKFDELCEEV